MEYQTFEVLQRTRSGVNNMPVDSFTRVARFDAYLVPTQEIVYDGAVMSDTIEYKIESPMYVNVTLKDQIRSVSDNNRYRIIKVRYYAHITVIWAATDSDVSATA